MQLVRTLIWVIIAVAISLFAAANWKPVAVNLWGDTIVETRLAFLIIVAFLAGAVPPFLFYRTRCWRLSRRLAQSERALAEAQGLGAEAVRDDGVDSPVAPVLPPHSGSAL